MSKYTPLRELLDRARTAELPVTFAELEEVLGFPLPPSARKHSAWWSNNVSTHVAVRVWRDAGWRTSRVDLSGERVVFVREAEGAQAQRAGGRIEVPRSALSPGALDLLAQEAEQNGGDWGEAAAMLINQRARGLLLSEIAKRAEPSNIDSTAVIRAARDAR